MAERVYLEDIVKTKKERIQGRYNDRNGLLETIKTLAERPSFYEALGKPGLSIIGEVKKASPSKGLIKADFRPLEIAELYGGAVDAISVLTEEDYFLGQDEYLKAISARSPLPTLCKDFIVEEKQIYNAKALGASAVLLIVAILTDEQIKAFLKTAEGLGLDVLVEVHTAEEMERALKQAVKIIGINNRDLKTFVTSLDVTLALRPMVPAGILVVSESGIDKIEDIVKLKDAHIDAILVGESFMRTGDIRSHAKGFKDAYRD